MTVDMLRRGLRLFTSSRDFAWLMGAQFLAQAGDGIVQAALAKSIAFGNQEGFDLENARSPDELLRIVLYMLVPYTIVSPFLGVLIDRWDRRRLLFVANGLRAAVVAIVALVGTEAVPDVALFLAFLLTVASTRVVLATKSAALPVTLHDESLVEGNAVSQLGGAMFQLGGAGAALVASGIVETDLIVAAGALVYAAGAACALLLRRAGEVRPTKSLIEELAHVARSIVDGVQEVARTPKAAAAITTYFWIRFLWSFSIVAIGFIARELLAGDDLTLIILTGGSGAIGAALGFVLARSLQRWVRTTAHLVLTASGVAGGAVVVFGPLGFSAAIAILTFFLGLGFFLAKISLDTLVQEALGDDFRGRAFSLYDIAYNVAWVLAAGILKLLWGPSGRGALIAGVGVLFLVGLAALGAWYRRAGLLQITVEVESRA